MSSVRLDVDRGVMFWPAAALALFVLLFAIVYGTVVQARVAAARNTVERDRG
jgi:hypothetical protein